MGKVIWEEARDVKKSLSRLVNEIKKPLFDVNRVHCYRSFGSSANAYARMWGLPSVWQKALKVEPQYVLEVLSENFDKLNEQKRLEVLIHEITHVPSNFSGALLPHIRHGKRNFRKKVDAIIQEYFKNKIK